LKYGRLTKMKTWKRAIEEKIWLLSTDMLGINAKVAKIDI